MRHLTLTWDDGFRASSVTTAGIFERFGLRTEFNVLAAPNPDAGMGDFGLWNELQARGHTIQPHGYNHTNKASIPLAEAQELIRRCLGLFEDNLNGFVSRDAIFNFPYNASTPELEAWLPTVVRAFRTGPGPALYPLPGPDTIKLTTCGWEAAEEWLDICLSELLAAHNGWLIYNAHGLNGEGWGPMRSVYLERLLEKLVQRDDLTLLPARSVLDAFSGVSKR